MVLIVKDLLRYSVGEGTEALACHNDGKTKLCSLIHIGAAGTELEHSSKLRGLPRRKVLGNTICKQ